MTEPEFRNATPDATRGHATCAIQRVLAAAKVRAQVRVALVALLLQVLIGGGVVAQTANQDASDLIDLLRSAAEDARFEGRVVAANQADIISMRDSAIAQIRFPRSRA